MKRGLTLDTGALIAIERGDEAARAIVNDALVARRPVHILPEVLAQVWRDGARQVHLARLLGRKETTLLTLTPSTAKVVGIAAGVSGVSDVVDVHVAVHARQHGHIVVTSDPDDIRAVDPSLTVIEV